MRDSSSPEDRAGWEHSWRSGNIPPRYQTNAVPNATVVEWADAIAPGGSVLDVGCGIGRHVVYLSERGFRMAGVDISPSAIVITRAACKERQFFFDGRVSDITSLPWADSAFDAALATSVIHHHRRRDILTALGEVRRVLKPGGLFLADFPSVGTVDYDFMRRQVAAGKTVEVEPNTFVETQPESDDSDGFLPHHFVDEDDLRNLVRRFDVVRLWAALHETARSTKGSGMTGKWVVWLSRPLTG